MDKDRDRIIIMEKLVTLVLNVPYTFWPPWLHVKYINVDAADFYDSLTDLEIIIYTGVLQAEYDNLPDYFKGEPGVI